MQAMMCWRMQMVMTYECQAIGAEFIREYRLLLDQNGRGIALTANSMQHSIENFIH
jgi:hypothetical protein